MPAGGLIVGVDLAPIKPIPRTIMFQSDITSDKCRATIRQHLKTWKADTVLHDGAPNVGIAWVQDAFSQAELVLQALKLATDFLIEGGTFVTKVFRSKDYNALLWVFGQLFRKVEATKPPSSRNVSAEIFVVCREYKAPKRIDPKFLDPRAVFAELSDPTPNNEAKVYNPEKKKRKREGYAEGDYTQFREAPASEFIQTQDPIAMLATLNTLTFRQNEGADIALAVLDRLPETTDEIRQCCNDLRVLGRKEFRILLRWRLKAREIFGLAPKKDDAKVTETGEEVAEITPMDEELQIQEDLEKLNEQESARKKRQRRRENERKQKEIVRMQLNMNTPTEIGLDQPGLRGEASMFGLADVDKACAIDRVAKGQMSVPVQKDDAGEDEDDEDEATDEEEDALDGELDDLYSQYRERKLESDAKYRAKKARHEHEDGEWHGISDANSGSDEDVAEEEGSAVSSDEEDENTTGQLIFPKHSTARGKDGMTTRATQFFEQDIFKSLGPLTFGEDNDSAVDLQADEADTDQDYSEPSTSQSKPPSGKYAVKSTNTADTSSDESGEESGLNGHPQARMVTDEDNESYELVKNDIPEWEAQDEPRKNGRLDIDIITAEAMTLAQQLASGQTSTYNLVDDSFNKYSLRDTDGLPEWFLDDEGKHSKPQRPITAAGAAAIKEKLRALNARPIKKVQEAKDRKKFRAARRLEKLKKKSAMVAEEEGVSERDKAQNIAKLLSKAAKKKPKQQVKLVVAKGGNRGISGRPRGVKGKYKIVDARLKKDTRAEKRLAKKKR